jgi:two-component system, LytTR family, response regulator LytT
MTKMRKASINETADNTVSTLTANALSDIEKKAQISFTIRLEGKMYFVLVENIAFIYLEDKTVYLLDFNGNKHAIFKTLDTLEKAIPPQQFYRINRQMIVNRQAIKDVERFANRRVVVHLTIPTSENNLVPRLKVKRFLSWIEKG